MRVLFVCLGNICRSPTAEAVCRVKVAQLSLGWSLDSAGTSGWHVGDPPYGPMQKAARARGYEMGDLRARGFSAADFEAFDLIVGMDAANIAAIEALRPPGNDTRVCLMTDGIAGADEVPDPYYTRDFDGALDLIETAVDALVTTTP